MEAYDSISQNFKRRWIIDFCLFSHKGNYNSVSAHEGYKLLPVYLRYLSIHLHLIRLLNFIFVTSVTYELNLHMVHFTWNCSTTCWYFIYVAFTIAGGGTIPVRAVKYYTTLLCEPYYRTLPILSANNVTDSSEYTKRMSTSCCFRLNWAACRVRM